MFDIEDACQIAIAYADDAKSRGQQGYYLEMSTQTTSRFARALARELRSRGHLAYWRGPANPPEDLRRRPTARKPKCDNPGIIEFCF